MHVLSEKTKQELSDLLSTKNVSIIRPVNCEDLANFRIDNVNLQIQLKSPTFYQIVSEKVTEKVKKFPSWNIRYISHYLSLQKQAHVLAAPHFYSDIRQGWCHI